MAQWLARMTPFEMLSILLTFMTVILIPLTVAAFRIVVKWTRVEYKLDSAVTKLGEIAAREDTIHAELIAQMRDDRHATDERLRWLERRRGPGVPGSVKP